MGGSFPWKFNHRYSSVWKTHRVFTLIAGICIFFDGFLEAFGVGVGVMFGGLLEAC